MKPWPRLWVNLRSSRATELADAFPSKVAADWLGHTEAIADKHYRQTTREHFERAIKGDNSALLVALSRGASSGITEQDSPKASLAKDPENAEKSKKQAVSQRTTKPRKWTIQDSNLGWILREIT